MGDLTFIKDYKEDKIIRSSLNALIQENCGYSLEEWYEKGYWQEQYIPYSFVKDEMVIANVSVCKQEMLFEGVHKSAISLEHILLHPKYRYQSLLEDLMKRIIEDYKEKVDFVYLIAHEAVTPMYTKLGFKYVEDRQICIKTAKIEKSQAPQLIDITKLDEDIKKYPETFTVLSKGVKWINNASRRHFECSNGEIKVYNFKESDTYVIVHFEDGILNIIDILSKQIPEVDEIIAGFKAIYEFDKVRLYSDTTYKGCGNTYEEVGSQLLFMKYFNLEEEVFPIIVGDE